MNLRPYQSEAVDSAFAAWRTGNRSTLFVCATGGGKSIVFTKVIERHIVEGGRRALVLADRKWLVEQAAASVSGYTALSVGVEMAAQHVDRSALPAVVCTSVQTFARRLSEFSDAFDLLVIDEADLALAPAYRRIVDAYPAARVFGCTATPDRSDGLALREVFESVCLDVDIRDLIDASYLSRVRQWPVKVLDLSRVKVRDEDFDEAILDRIMQEERHLHEVVRPTIELAGNRPTLVFGVTIAHAEKLAAVFNRYHPGSARAVSGRTSKVAQRRAVEDFVAKEFQFLCNCNLVMRGVDIPPIACVAMARPTRSRTVYVQGIGRGTRLSPETGKTDLLVLDFTDGASDFTLVSTVDVLGGRASPEACERAREIVEEEPGSDVGEALDRAVEDLAKDDVLRERVRAKVRYRTREIAALRDPIDWRSLPLGVESDASIAERIGTTAATVTCARHRLGIKMFGAVDGKAV